MVWYILLKVKGQSSADILKSFLALKTISPTKLSKATTDMCVVRWIVLQLLYNERVYNYSFDIMSELRTLEIND